MMHRPALSIQSILKLAAIFLVSLLLISYNHTAAAEPLVPQDTSPLLAPDATNAVASDFMGVWLIPSQDADALPALKTAGASWARIAIGWSTVQPTRSAAYNWTSSDSRIKQLRNQGYNVILAIMHMPSWAADYDCGPIKPQYLPDFADFVKEATKRYSVSPYNVRYLEMGNEPDSGDVVNHAWVGGCWGIGPNPAPGAGGAAYADMLKAIYPAVKSANPNMQVALGGLSYEAWTTEGGPFDPNFLNDILAAGGGDYFDIINYHFYEAFSYRWGSVVGKGQQIQAIVRAATGKNKPLMVTEFSTPSSKPSGTGDVNNYDEELQARYVMKGLTQGIGAGIYPMVWFQAIDRPENSGGYSYGLIRSNGGLKPAYRAYNTFNKELGTYTYSRRLSGLDGRIEGHTFAKGGSQKHIVWTLGQNVNQAFAVGAAGNTLRVIEKDGADYTAVDGGGGDLDNARDGAVTITVGHSPLIVEPNASSSSTNNQSISLDQGWNLISYAVDLSNTSVQSVLNSITGKYIRVLGQNGTYDTSVPSSFNTLSDMALGEGYWILMKNAANLSLTGASIDVRSPISLKQGWNWIGYLPATVRNVPVALSSINGRYSRVIGSEGTYDTSVPPSFNTLQQMRQGQGYQVLMTRNGTLVYPADPSSHSVEISDLDAQEIQESIPDAVSGPCLPQNLFPIFNEVRGFISPDAPVGATVTAHNPDGQVVGCWTVDTANQYGYMRVFMASDQNAGMNHGEPVRFKVNGIDAVGSFVFSALYQAVEVNLTIPSSPTATPTNDPTTTTTPTTGPGPTSTPTPTATPTRAATPTPPPNVWRFRGCTYAGEPGLSAQMMEAPDQSVPCPEMAALAGVRLDLYGWNEGQTIPATPFTTLMTSSDGFFSFFITPPTGQTKLYDFYRLIAVPPAGMVNTAAWSDTGTFMANGMMDWASPAPRVHLNEFYIAAPTPTPTPQTILLEAPPSP